MQQLIIVSHSRPCLLATVFISTPLPCLLHVPALPAPHPCPVRSYLTPLVIVPIRPRPCSHSDPQLLFGVNRATPVTLCCVDTNPST